MRCERGTDPIHGDTFVRNYNNRAKREKKMEAFWNMVKYHKKDRAYLPLIRTGLTQGSCGEIRTSVQGSCGEIRTSVHFILNLVWGTLFKKKYEIHPKTKTSDSYQRAGGTILLKQYRT